MAVNLAAEEARRKTAAQAYAIHHKKEQELINEHNKFRDSVPKVTRSYHASKTCYVPWMACIPSTVGLGRTV